MRKSLFLTLALSLATFVGANAQWTMTLSGNEGLPGSETVKNGVTVMHYKSGIIKPDQPIQSLRFTVAATQGNAKSEARKHLFFSLSELSVLSPDASKEYKYTATSNFDHNTITGTYDGQGLKALNDGRYNNYFHSLWIDEEGVEGEAPLHYIELTFEEPLERFILDWGGRPNFPRLAPTVVVLTEGGKEGVPYAESKFALKEQITDLSKAEFVAIKGHALEVYDITTHTGTNAGTVDKNNKDLEGVGDMFVSNGKRAAKEANAEHATQLIPVEGEADTYYVYYPGSKMYLSRMGGTNSWNEAQNGDQSTTSNLEEAAAVKFTKLSNGDYELSYTLETEESEFNVYIGADPRNGGMKLISDTKKPEIEEKGWTQGFGIKLKFNWTVYEADYNAPEWTREYELGRVYTNALELKELYSKMFPDYNEEIEEAINTTSEIIANINDKTEEEVNEGVAEVKESISAYLKNLVIDAYNEATDVILPEYSGKISDEPKAGYYPREAYDTYIVQNLRDVAYGLYQTSRVSSLYDHIDEVNAYFANKQNNIDNFLALGYVFHDMPTQFNVTQGDWTQEVNLVEAVNGIRLTITEIYSDGQKYNDYPLVALRALEILDGEGTKLALDENLVTTNSLELSEGSMAALFDNDDATFYHSIWKDGTMEPKGYVYLDIKFPERTNLSNFTIKTYGRNGHAHISPKTIVLTSYGKTFDPQVDRPNPYKVAKGNIVTDLAQLADGKVYIINGNLNVNLDEGTAEPRFYSGLKPYHTDANVAANDTCVYMLKAVEGGFNVISLGHGEYLSGKIDPDNGNTCYLTPYQSEAAVVKFEKSTNMKDTWVMYSEVADTTYTAAWSKSHTIDTGEQAGTTVEFKIDSTAVKVNKRIFMDWNTGMNSRLCVGVQPGEFEVGSEIKQYPELLLNSDAGDNLHFNKTNGEGEWTIYEATMNDAYFLMLKALVRKTEELKFTVGINPGDLIADEDVQNSYNSAIGKAKATVNSNNRANAEKAATDLVAAMDAMKSAQRVGFNPEAEYLILSAMESFYTNTWDARAMYMGTEKLNWGVCPKDFVDENLEFLFKIIKLNEDNLATYLSRGLQSAYGEFTEEDKANAYVIKPSTVDQYLGSDLTLSESASIFFIENVDHSVYGIRRYNTGEGANYMHANNHGGGWGQGSDVIYYGGLPSDANSASAWTFQLINEDTKESVENIVVEGDEVVSIEYYTPAGVALSAPVNGINIIVKKYANGVVEAQKVIVK